MGKNIKFYPEKWVKVIIPDTLKYWQKNPPKPSKEEVEKPIKEENDKPKSKIEMFFKKNSGKITLFSLLLAITSSLNECDKELINQHIRDIKNEFNPEEIAKRDTNKNTDIKAIYFFQESVLDLIYLKEPHERTKFGNKASEVVEMVRDNIDNRQIYNSYLENIFSNVDEVQSNQKIYTYNILNKEYTPIDNRQNHSNLNRIYKEKVRDWVSKDSARNEKVMSEINAPDIIMSTSLSRLNNAIQPLVDFGNDTYNYEVREMIYYHLLYLNNQYMKTVKKYK